MKSKTKPTKTTKPADWDPTLTLSPVSELVYWAKAADAWLRSYVEEDPYSEAAEEAGKVQRRLHDAIAPAQQMRVDMLNHIDKQNEEIRKRTIRIAQLEKALAFEVEQLTDACRDARKELYKGDSAAADRILADAENHASAEVRP
jgi:hypothetical protein